MSPLNFDTIDDWVEQTAPRANVVVSSRARYARNLTGHPFAPRARGPELLQVCANIDRAVQACESARSYYRVEIHGLSELDRRYLKESHLISAEMEKGGEGRVAFFSPNIRMSILVNEEDHIRMQCFEPGLQLGGALEALNGLDDSLGAHLPYAFHERFGFLTACPTNTGAGLRVSVMLHLPALVLTNTVEEIIQHIPQYGLTARGFYGENSEFLGDFFQISNEVTLGKTEEKICHDLEHVVNQIIEREQAARSALFEEKRVKVEDTIWRAFGFLSHSRMVNSREALKMLSHLRLGIDQGMLSGLTHSQLNRLMIEVQPAHLQRQEKREISDEARDIARADLLRRRLEKIDRNQA